MCDHPLRFAQELIDFHAVKYNSKPAKYWDDFYKYNESNFFKDRKWLHNEFPELVDISAKDVRNIITLFSGTYLTIYSHPLPELLR